MSILPEVLESVRRQLRVPYRMLDVLVPHVRLDRPGVLALGGKVVARCVLAHVGVDGESDPRQFPCLSVSVLI